jgi:protoheme IX farnesyltransferase
LDSCSEAAYVTTSNSLSESLFHPHQLEDKVKERSDLEGDGGQSIDDMMCKEMKPSLDYTLLPLLYIKLAKIRLTGLVVVTSMAGYALAPGSFDAASFLLCCIGTCFTSASANAINQFFEVPFDSQMTRTRTRPLVRALLSPLHAVSFAAFTGVTGTVMLACGINQLTATLGVLNLLLYTMFYTPMKRLNIANTWLGSVVGAIPPMMGWAASAGTLHTGALLLGAIMYAWQFPHFCALSWNLRPDYSRAGYRMMSVVNPALCQRTALQYSMMLSGLCTLLPYFEVTTWTFAVDSLPLNLCLVYLAWRFYNSGDSSTSRRLFHFSLIHIPALLILMLISKKHFGDVVTGDGFTSSRNIQ